MVRVVVGTAVDEVGLLVDQGRLMTQGRSVVMAAIDVLHRGGRGRLVMGMVVAETAIAKAGTGHGDRSGGGVARVEGTSWIPLGKRAENPLCA